MIQIKNVYKSFNDQLILNGINLTVEPGETVALIGASGEGQSVLLKHIIGLLEPDQGQILIDGMDIHRLRGTKLRRLKERFGIVFQAGALFDSLTVFENVAFPLNEKTRLPADEIREKVLKELSSVELRGHEDKYPAQISGGMQKRVALARCLVMDPEIILFDEPTTGLDPMTAKSIHSLIRRLQKNKHLTAVIVSHEIPEIFNIVDKVAMLHNGKILTVATPEAFNASDDKIIQQFLHGELEQ